MVREDLAQRELGHRARRRDEAHLIVYRTVRVHPTAEREPTDRACKRGFP
jgi:hypothetical protein